MPQLDGLKEQLAYMKFWLGIIAVTDISLVGWLISAVDTASPALRLLAFGAVAALTAGIGVLHRQIEQRLEQIGKL